MKTIVAIGITNAEVKITEKKLQELKKVLNEEWIRVSDIAFSPTNKELKSNAQKNLIDNLEN